MRLLFYSVLLIGSYEELDCLGSALTFATSDVTTKLTHVQNRTREMIDAGIITTPYEEVTIEVCLGSRSYR